MDLNEMRPGHEEATVSMKIVLLVFGIVLVGALGYLVWAQNTAPDTTNDSATTVKTDNTPGTATSTTTTAKASAVDCGDKAYAFSLAFGSLWTDHKIKAVTPTDAIITCHVNLPTTDAAFAAAGTTNLAGHASLFAVSVYTPAQWTTAMAGANAPTELGHNSAYYWGWSPAQSYPAALQATVNDLGNVVASFKIGS